MNWLAMSPSIKRSRFLVNTVTSQISSSSDSPTNQRNSRLYSSCSISCRSEADRIEGLQQQGSKQSLGRDRRPTKPGVQPLEFRRQRRQRLVHNPQDRSQRMILWNPSLAIHITEQHVAPHIPSAHRTSPQISSRSADYTPD